MAQGKGDVDGKHYKKSKLSQVAKQFSIGTQVGLCPIFRYKSFTSFMTSYMGKTGYNLSKWSKEKLGMAKPSTFDADFLITEKSFRALEKLLNDLVKFIVIYLQPKTK